MKVKLVLHRTNHDAVNAWTDIKTVVIDLPLTNQDGWHVVGIDWEYESEYLKSQQERIEMNRLIDTLENEIDELTGRSRLQRREVPERLTED